MRFLGLKLQLQIFIVSCCLMTSCTPQKSPSDLFHISEAIEVGNEQMRDFVEITHLIPIREPDYIIGRYDALRVHDSLIYVMDKMQHKIHILTMNGNLHAEIDRVGTGPGEYSSIEDFDIDSQGNVWIFCSSEKKALQYTANGQFLSDVPVCSGTEIKILSDNRLAIYSNIHSDTVVSLYHPAENTHQGIYWEEPRPNALLKNGGDVYETTEGIFFTNPFDYSLYKISGNEYDRVLQFDFDSRNLPEDFNKEQDRKSILKEIQKNQKMIYLKNLNLYNEWIIIRNHEHDLAFFNRDNGKAYLFSELSSPLSTLFADLIHIHKDGTVVASVSASNIQNALLPTLSLHKDTYTFLNVLNSPDVESYMENDWIMIGKMKL